MKGLHKIIYLYAIEKKPKNKKALNIKMLNTNNYTYRFNFHYFMIYGGTALLPNLFLKLTNRPSQV